MFSQGELTLDALVDPADRRYRSARPDKEDPKAKADRLKREEEFQNRYR
jgi:hypothetical protein